MGPKGGNEEESILMSALSALSALSAPNQEDRGRALTRAVWALPFGTFEVLLPNLMSLAGFKLKFLVETLNSSLLKCLTPINIF